MAKIMTNDELGLALARAGNVSLALSRNAEEEDPSRRARLHRAIRREHRVQSAFLAPIIGKSRGSCDFLCPVEITDRADASPSSLTAEAKESVEQALDDAWRLVGGPGTRPRVGVSLGFVDRLEGDLSGRSLYLPVALAAVAKFGESSPVENIIATGHPSAELEDEERKQAVAQRCAEALRSQGLLVTSLRNARAAASTRMEALAAVVRRVFAFEPWHPRTAGVIGIHLYTSNALRHPPGRFVGRSLVVERLSEGERDLDKSDLPAIWQKVEALLERGDRFELSIGGPLIVAAWLGHKLHNKKKTVRIIHDELPWWDNRVRFVWGDKADSAAASVARIIQSTQHPVPPPWEEYPTRPGGRPNLEPGDLPGMVRGFLERFGTGTELHIGFQGPSPVPWAIARALQNRSRATFYHRTQKGVYEAWFDNG